MTRFSVVSTIGMVAIAGSLVLAQAAPQGAPPGQGRGGRGPAQPPPQNLQVFPKDTPRAQVVQTMQAFTQALGVTCAHCHVFYGNNDPMNDMASDMKPQKEIARNMLRMVREINPMVQKAVAPVKTDGVAAVNCMMCHRGAVTPAVAAAAPPGRGGPGAPGAPGGAPGGGRGNQ